MTRAVGTTRRRRILVVDDEQELAGAFVDLLAMDGHQALAVHDGPAALAAVRAFCPDVVFLDLGLPEMNGYEIARRLREEHGDKKILLIAMSGSRIDARLGQTGFDQYLSKPPDFKKLSALLALDTA